MKSKFIVCLLAILLSAFTNEKYTDDPVEKSFKTAIVQYKEILERQTDLSQYPRSASAEGIFRSVLISDWTGGFWPGSLWYVYEFTKDEFWKNAAMKWTNSLSNNQFNTSHHDLGFMMYSSYGNGYRLTKDTTYLPLLIQSAKSLISRYSKVTGSIKSWDLYTSVRGEKYTYPVIIDNMMNLELLFFASEQTGDPVYSNIAIKHAESTMKNHLREDYSSYHVVNYDEKTGQVIDKKSAQGFSDNSMWARGQTWGIYGFTTVYRATRDRRFLLTAQRMANAYLNHNRLPEDLIPYWDFNAGQPGYHPEWGYDPKKYLPIPRDASAAAIAASALLELCTYSSPSLKKRYFKAAEKMLKTLSSEVYTAKAGTNGNFILKNSVGHMPKDKEVNSALVYADYYFLEGLIRYKKARL